MTLALVQIPEVKKEIGPRVDIFYAPETFGSLLSLVREVGIIVPILQVRENVKRG